MIGRLRSAVPLVRSAIPPVGRELSRSASSALFRGLAPASALRGARTPGAVASIATTSASVPSRKRRRLRVPVIMASGDVVAEHEVVLTDLESRIFDLVRGAVRTGGLETVVRVAGGWVRDKVLGRENHDIDFALDNMTGVAFAEALNAHLAASGEATHKVSVIQANPEQSKHLETATVNVLGEQLDLVNLRAEEYASDSRIPTVRFGSAEEDAMRRDFTINALFFNVNDETIEDLTGHGFADLGAGVLRTPLAPETTLLDDPLRVLRAVRFAARFGFRLAPDLRDALELPAVRLALAGKVSRERIGSELDGMLSSARPVGALRMLHARGLLPVVLAVPRLLSHDDAHAAAAVIKAASAKGRKGRAAPSAEAAAGPALDQAVALLEVPEPTADATADEVALADAGMAVVDAVDALASAAAGATSACAGAAAAASAAADDTTSTRAVKVVRGTALLGEDAGRAAAIEAERAAEAAHAPEREAQQHPDRTAGWRGVSAAERRLVLLAACLWPARDGWTLGTEGKERGKPARTTASVLRNSLKRRGKDGDDVGAMHDAVPLLLAAAAEAQRAGWLDGADVAALGGAAGGDGAAAAASSGPGVAESGAAATEEERACLTLGLAVRAAGELTGAALALTAALAASEACGQEGTRAERLERLAGPAASAWAAARKLEGLVSAKGLDRCWERKPVVDGKELRGMGVKPGPAMRPVMEAQALWQLAHPRGTDDECRAAVAERVAATRG